MEHTTNHNLAITLRECYSRQPDATAIEVVDPVLGGTTTLSYQALDAGAAMVANFLVSVGLPPGSRVAVHCEKSPEVLMLYLAVLRAGLVFVPLNPAYKEELSHFFTDAKPAVVVTSPLHCPWVGALARNCGVQHVFTLGTDGSGTLFECAACHSIFCDVAHKSADETAVIIYTSGTTGVSKGAMLSHGNLESNAKALYDFWGWRSLEQGGDVLVHALPIYHVHGLFVACHLALLGSSKVRWLNKFDAEAVAGAFTKASVFMGVPTMYTRLLRVPKLVPQTCTNMRLFTSGSAPLLPETHQAFEAKTGHKIVERYGMSETGMLTSNPYWTGWSGSVQRRPGTVGVALPGVTVRVCDDNGALCEPGVTGNVQVSGSNVFAGYWQRPDLNETEFTADGFFKTGDVGNLDTKGVLTLVGRSKDLIITGGLNVYPAEVESVINQVAEVEECAVVAAPHRDFGESVVAVVVCKPGAVAVAERVTAFVKERLAGFKVPRVVAVVRELPRNGMGKVLKGELRKQFVNVFEGD